MVDAPSSKWGVHHWHRKRVTTPLVKQFAIEAMAIEVVDLSNNSMMMFQLVFVCLPGRVIFFVEYHT